MQPKVCGGLLEDLWLSLSRFYKMPLEDQMLSPNNEILVNNLKDKFPTSAPEIDLMLSTLQSNSMVKDKHIEKVLKKTLSFNDQAALDRHLRQSVKAFGQVNWMTKILRPRNVFLGYVVFEVARRYIL